MESGKEEKKFTFTKTGIKMVNGEAELEEQEYILKESELENQHIQLLTGELIKYWNDSPKEVQSRFLQELTYQIKQKDKELFNTEFINSLAKRLLNDGE